MISGLSFDTGLQWHIATKLSNSVICVCTDPIANVNLGGASEGATRLSLAHQNPRVKGYANRRRSTSLETKLHGDTRSQHGWAQTQWDISKIVIACRYPQKRWNMRFVTNCMGTPDHSTVGHKPTKWSEHASIHKRRSTRLVTKLNGDARSGQRPQNKHATRIESKHKGTPTKWS